MKLVPVPDRREVAVPRRPLVALAAALIGLAATRPDARGAFILQIDTDGLDDGVITYNPNFSFGGDTTTASQSAPSTAIGMSGGDSIFGGNGSVLPDTYVYSYTPSFGSGDVDNLALAAGTALNGSDLATGFLGGGSGTYAVYATWPSTANVSGSPTRYSMLHDGGLLSVDIEQNGQGNDWIHIGNVELSEDGSYQLFQEAIGSNSFVSMRSAGVMFEKISRDEPAKVPDGGWTLWLLSMALAPLAVIRHRLDRKRRGTG